MMNLFNWMEWNDIAESLGFRIQSDGQSYVLRRESDGEIMVENLTSEQVQDRLIRMKRK